MVMSILIHNHLAIHLELVEDMTAEQFLLALCRFITQLGKPDQIVLDNVSNFKATKNVADMAWEMIDYPSVHSYLSDQKIEWSFIIELSPWIGGFCGCPIGTTKCH